MAEAPSAPHFVAITPPNAAREPDIGRRWAEGLREGLSSAARAEPSGVRIALQVRDKQAEEQQIAALHDDLRRICPSLPVTLNGPPMRAKRLGFDGFHLPAGASETLEPRPKNRVRLLAGQSSHSLEEAARAAAAEVDYLVFGPVYDTPAKRPFGPPQGLDRLSSICDSVALPVLAIGGLDSSRVTECWRAGAVGVAAIRAAGDPQEVRRIIAALQHLMDETKQA